MKFHWVGVICLWLLTALSSSCVKRPEGVASDKKTAALVADLELAEAYIQSNPQYASEQKREALIEYIIENHGMSRAEYDSTMSWYARNVDEYYDLCDLVDRELARRRKKLTGQNVQEIASADLWPYPRQVMVWNLSGSNALEFSIPATQLESGQRLNMKMRVNGIANGQALLGVEYADGRKGYMSRYLSNARGIDLTFQTDTGRNVSRIFGNILLNDKRNRPLWLDSIYISALPFDSAEYHTTHGQRVYFEPKQRRKKKEEPKEELQEGTVQPKAGETPAEEPSQAMEKGVVTKKHMMNSVPAPGNR